MAEQKLQVGMFVVHPKRPEWGPGKVVKTALGTVYVVWRDLPDREAKSFNLSVAPLELAEDQHDEVLDNLPPVVEVGGKPMLPKERIPFARTVAEFSARFPLGFEDPHYIGDKDSGERFYKWAAHEKFVRMLGGGQFRTLFETDQPALIKAILSCERSVNLLSVFEKAAFKDAMKSGEPADRFLVTLCELLEADTISEEVFVPYIVAVDDLPAEGSKVASWPVATIIPFLAQPDRHIFLKPVVTKKAANALGFHLNYKSELNWLTYRRLLEMARIYHKKLASLKPRDMIDIQSFFWVAGGGYK